MKLIKYSDPGHGWVKVKKKHCEKIGFTPSGCSYNRGEYFYLEEDSDFPKFAKLYGEEIKLVEKWTNKRSKIRGY